MYFPIYIDLTDKNILIVGAGKIAARRISALCGFAERMTVVAPSVSEEVRTLARENPIRIFQRNFQESDLEGKDLVLAATDDRELNRRIREFCKEKGIPVNVSSDQELCDFQFPSIVQAGDVVIGINASGRDHRLVKETRRKLEAVMGVTDEESRYSSGHRQAEDMQ